MKSNSSLDHIEVQSQLLPTPSKIYRPHSATESPKKENSKFLEFIRKMKPKDFMAEYHKKTFYNAAANYALSLPCTLKFEIKIKNLINVFFLKWPPLG